ncbi:LPD7 domain-containing protein [Pseudomonas kitaguniensis]|uniref:LPD7 domain-containing protein n=1 Tax=Pseudomonas kitaguniensis TaxID=2607908 RepID=UPI003B9E32E1
MLIRTGGYNTGAQEYLEKGTKAGREFTRDELDHRLILDGNLDLTRAIYESIPDVGQDRYLTFTMSFKEDVVPEQTLRSITQEFKQFLMQAYQDNEYNFYAEAHLPKMKKILDKSTGEMIDRKPHVHIIVPRINLLSGNEANPVGVYLDHQKYFEAFQEYINQKYNLASPRENIRVDINDSAKVLSRYKGDDFYGKNREFKQALVTSVIDKNIHSRSAFYSLVAEYGETRVRNAGKDTEYIAVKLPGDAKFTNLKETIFQDHFIVNRELKKEPLDPGLINERLIQWPQRAREIKYVHKATPSFRKRYATSDPAERVALLTERETMFYQNHGVDHDRIRPIQRPSNHQRGSTKARAGDSSVAPDRVQNLPGSEMAANWQSRQPGLIDGAMLLPNDAHVHVGQPQPRGDLGLRSAVSGGGGGKPRVASEDGPSRRGRPSAFPTHEKRSGKRIAAGNRKPFVQRIPSSFLNPHKIPSVTDIQARGRQLFEPLQTLGLEGLKIEIREALVLEEPPQPKSRGGPTNVGDVNPTKPLGSGRSKSRTSGARNTVPPYARNPHRVPTLNDIQAHGRRIFDPLKKFVAAPLEITFPTVTPFTVNRSASSVAAQFSRKAEQNQLAPAQRHALRRINQQYFDVRRALFSDQRLTRQDKAQLLSVLTFERLKASELIKTSIHTEVHSMGSAQIRQLITDDKDEVAFSITAPRGPERSGIRHQVKKVMERFSSQIDPEQSKERTRELAAKDLYTRKSKFSQNVHYISKSTDKTLFVDTGTVIAMRRTGITVDGVGVALQLATQRFGSTLTINGTDEFKRLVVEAAAKGGMDIHFTDKKMNDALSLRVAELDIAKEGEQIQSPGTAEAAVPESAPVAPVVQPAPVAVDRSVVVGELVAHGPAPYKDDESKGLSYFVTINTEGGQKTLWGVALEEVMSEQAFSLGDRVKLKDLGQIPVNIPKEQADGTIQEVPGFRRAWSAETDSTSADPKVAAPAVTVSVEVPEAAITQVPAAAPPQPAAQTPAATALPEDIVQLVEQLASALEQQAAAATPSPSEMVRREEAWRKQFPANEGTILTEAEVLSAGAMMSLRGEDHAMWLVATNDHTPEGIAMVSKYLEHADYRETFKSTIEGLYERAEQSPEAIDSINEAIDFVVPIVNEIESRLIAEPGSVAANALMVDPNDAVAVAKQVSQLQAEVIHQTEAIASANNQINLNTNMRDNHAADRGPEFIDQCNALISAAELTIKSGTMKLTQAELALRQLSNAAPEALKFTHNGQPASLGLTPVPTRSVEATPLIPAAPIVLVDHKGDSVTVDPANAGDVAKHTRQLLNEVTVQGEKIADATNHIRRLVNMRDNHAAGREPEYIDQCNAEIGESERFIETGKAIVASAESNLQKLAPTAISLALNAAQASPVKSSTSPHAEPPAPLQFTHNGEPASLGLKDLPTRSVEAVQVSPGAPIVLVDHKGDSVTVDPADAGDVAKHTRQLLNEVAVQGENIAKATRQIGMLENMRDNHSAHRGPEYIDQCNVEIGDAKRFIEGGKTIMASAESNLQKLAPAAIAASLGISQVVSADSAHVTQSSELTQEAPSAFIQDATEIEEDFGPAMD